ncbi:hypothetical protein PM025_16160 [Halorubrum ezzemoulense]|uniref:hypothetical protein n=1 Tax=Halorubrum ezzemoulense TaxID=337243 RepID=UPI00232AB6E8|nr:hypothetical protein [Halorubrum ezzemoulense]MDB2265638.1 hypothetical protein [Halorubrum ezzemoulense]MDB9300297.1 hypothetical protein [Halorubrum ezzemoulense]
MASRDMDAVIPAAGRGSRLGELTADRPKGLVDVAGRPPSRASSRRQSTPGSTRWSWYEAGQIVERFGDAFEMKTSLG